MKYKTISVEDSETLITDVKPMILDCRDLKDYRQGHLDDALHVHEGLKESLIKKCSATINLSGRRQLS